MNAPANTAYHECIDLVELHQVTLSTGDQIEFIEELRIQLARKLRALRAEQKRRKAMGITSIS